MGAWAGNTCVGQLHCYRLDLPNGGHDHWPDWNKPWWVKSKPAALDLDGLVWAHACYHVGRSVETWLTECSARVATFAADCNWDVGRIAERLTPHCFSDEQLQELIGRARRGEQPTNLEWGADPSYFGRGIGTAMCRASIDWAWRHGYVAVLVTAEPDDLPTFSRHSGGLSRRTYARLGFKTIAAEGDSAALPEWANWLPEIEREVQQALAAGRSIASLHPQLMCLRKEDSN